MRKGILEYLRESLFQKLRICVEKVVVIEGNRQLEIRHEGRTQTGRLGNMKIHDINDSLR